MNSKNKVKSKMWSRCQVSLLNFAFFALAYNFPIACYDDPSRYTIYLKLKVITTDGKALSGFVISDEKGDIGRTNSFGEWSMIYENKGLEPFMLTLTSYRDSKSISKKVKVTFENKYNGSYDYFFTKLIEVPVKKLMNQSIADADSNDPLIVNAVKSALGKINFSVSTSENLPEFKKTKTVDHGIFLAALRKKILELTLTHALDSKWQVFIEPFEIELSSGKKFKNLNWIKVTSKLPFDDKRIQFFVEKEETNEKTVDMIFSKLRDKIRYPYLVKRLKGKWFVFAKKSEQKGFWKFKNSYTLGNSTQNVTVAKKYHDTDDFILFSLNSNPKELCGFPNKDSCYLYNLPHITKK